MSFFIKPAYDADASAYFTTAGVTSIAGRQQISRFVTGTKDLGMWSIMVCWPMRSYQNSESGSTLYSLGGLTSRNLLITGTQRSNDGMIFNGSTDWLSGSQISASQNKAIGYYGKISSFFEDATPRTAMYIDGVSLRSSTDATYGITSVGQVTAGDGTVISGLDVGVWHGAGGAKTTTNVTRTYNDSLSITSNGSLTSFTGGISIGWSGATAGTFSGTIAFSFWLQSSTLFLNNRTAFHSLCRTTLLQGIPVP